MPKPTGEEIARHYAAAHERIVAIASGLTVEQAATPVPATPRWSVHDVVAHLVAVTTDGLAGRIQGIPNEDQTAQQVAERRDRSVVDLLGEWSPNVAQMLDWARAGLVPATLAVDAVTHEQDLRGALGHARVADVEAIRFSNSLYARGSTRRVRAAGLAPLRIVATDTADDYGHDGDAPITLSAPAFELFRALAGRRSRAQVVAYDWQGDAAAHIEVINVFGPLRDDDVTE